MAFFIALFHFVLLLFTRLTTSQPPPIVGGALAGGAPPPPPPGRGFQLQCTDDYAYEDQTDPDLVRQFAANAPPGYTVVSVEPSIYPGKNAHRFLVKYRSQGHRRCEEIRNVYYDMNNYKPQNSNVGDIAVVPGGYLVTYMKYCRCYRRSYRRRRSNYSTFKRECNETEKCNTSLSAFPHGYFVTPPRNGPGGTTMRCDDRDLSCGYQSF